MAKEVRIAEYMKGHFKTKAGKLSDNTIYNRREQRGDVYVRLLKDKRKDTYTKCTAFKPVT